MIGRRSALAAIAVGTALPIFAAARRPRVGVVWNSRPQADIDRGRSVFPNSIALEEGLRALGWIDGENLQLVTRTAEMDYTRLPRIIDEFVSLPVDVIVVYGQESAELALARTRTIPVVSGGGYLGTAAPRSTNNFTGITYVGSAPAMKRVQLLKALAPRISTVAMFARATPGREPPQLQPHHHQAAKSMGLVLFADYFDTAQDLDALFERAKRRGADAAYMPVFPLLTWSAPVQQQTVEAAMRHRLPTVYESPSLAKIGALLAYGVDDAEGSRRAPYYIDRLLRGARPSDLPIEQVNKVYLNINRRAARELGLSVPSTLLVQADNVYD